MGTNLVGETSKWWEDSYITGTDLPVDSGYTAMSAEGFGEKSIFAGQTTSVLKFLHVCDF